MARVRRARAKAKALATEYGQGAPPVDLDRIAAALGAEIRYSHEFTDNISGVLVPMGDGRWVIGVNANHADTRQRFTIAHEIGHLVLHDFEAPHADGVFQLRMRNERSSDGSIDEEIEANQFAAELLMPANLLLKELASRPIEYVAPDFDTEYEWDILRIAQRFKVSRQSLAFRLTALGVL